MPHRNRGRYGGDQRECSIFIRNIGTWGNHDCNCIVLHFRHGSEAERNIEQDELGGHDVRNKEMPSKSICITIPHFVLPSER